MNLVDIYKRISVVLLHTNDKSINYDAYEITSCIMNKWISIISPSVISFPQHIQIISLFIYGVYNSTWNQTNKIICHEIIKYRQLRFPPTFSSTFKNMNTIMQQNRISVKLLSNTPADACARLSWLQLAFHKTAFIMVKFRGLNNQSWHF